MVPNKVKVLSLNQLLEEVLLNSLVEFCLFVHLYVLHLKRFE